MTTLRRNSNQSMQRPKAQNNTGWAAFNKQHQMKNGQLDKSSSDSDPFPPISNSTLPTSNIPPTMKSFSSVIRPCNNNKDDSVKNKSDLNQEVKLLKEMFNWADESLIEDVLAGVNNDLNMASEILSSMVSSESFETGETSFSREKCDSNADNKDSVLMEKEGTSSSDKENVTMNSSTNDSIFPRLFNIPIEPEWEQDDDLYLSHRKDALKLMRAASNHSRSASNAFRRGDHLSARQLSKRAQEEWAEAERLNSKAAEEILKLRNLNNDLWKLDLHGLHASESVQAVQERLYEIENVDRSKMGSRKMVLHVITGSGNHSKGQASLPAAVKSFLIDNGYRFEEERPGVIAVRPKFRFKI
ncbi:hypothetical protein LUZ60_004538 [Juncus effusus]|nr:hypothetical protein LUZ60_004538 [Juncus effusus]